MEMNYTFFYIEANVVCIIIFFMMLVRDLGSVGRQAKQILFLITMISHMLYFTSDILWVLIMADYIPHTAFSAACVNISNAVFLCAITSCWFVYVELSQGEEYITNPKARLIAMIPAMVEVVAMLFLFTFFPHLMIDENREMTYIYYIVFISIPVLYICVSGGRSFARALRKENFAVRGQYLVCAIYPVIISIFGVWQTMWLNAPLFCFGCTIIMLYVYIISLNDQVSIDELTKLNNRTQLKKYIVSEHSRQGSDKVVRYILMMDLNKFKYINDQFGHIEGDRALKRTADALRSACGSNPLRSFIARYGGDEFIVIARTENEDQIIELSRIIKEKIVQLNEESGSKYELTASIGYASYSSSEIADFQAALAKADEELYKDKAKRKQAEKATVS